MTFKWRYVVLFILIVVAGIGAVTYRLTFTPYGRLDYRAALSIHFLTFNYELKPDPKSDFFLTVPLNMFFVVSSILPKEEVSKFQDIKIPGESADIPARAYWPEHWDRKKPLPVLVYFHGGGFVLGDVKTFDALARSLSNATNGIVVSVDYRLAPAHPYPAAVNDSYAALTWVSRNAQSLGGDATKLVVAGDSAGGNLATVVCLKARDQGGPAIAAQILYYPATDLTDKYYASKDHFGDGYGLLKQEEAAFHRAYIGHIQNTTDPYISPLYAPSLAHLPPVLVFTEGFDPLTDSTKAYIERLQQEGVAVTWHHYPETIHGFMSVPLFSQRRLALEETAQFWNRLFLEQTPK